MLLIVYGAVALVFTVAILAYAAQGAPLPPRPVYPAPIAVVAAQQAPRAIPEPVWDARVCRFRDAKGRFVKRPIVV